jgi:hypothetical protein
MCSRSSVYAHGLSTKAAFSLQTIPTFYFFTPMAIKDSSSSGPGKRQATDDLEQPAPAKVAKTSTETDHAPPEHAVAREKFQFDTHGAKVAEYLDARRPNCFHRACEFLEHTAKLMGYNHTLEEDLKEELLIELKVASAILVQNGDVPRVDLRENTRYDIAGGFKRANEMWTLRQCVALTGEHVVLSIDRDTRRDPENPELGKFVVQNQTLARKEYPLVVGIS